MANSNAKLAYENRKAEVKTRMEHLRQLIRDHEQAIKTYETNGDINWGHVGDLAHVAELLQQVEEFLTGQE